MAWRALRGGEAAAGAPVAWELEPCGASATRGHLHLRLDPADRSGSLRPGPATTATGSSRRFDRLATLAEGGAAPVEPAG